MADLTTPFGTFPAAPADGTAPTVLLWLVTILVLVLAVVCVLLWQQIKSSREKCQQENEKARADAADARLEAKRDADLARDKIEDLYRQAVEQMATREAKLTEVVTANTEVMKDIREIGSGYYRTLREGRNPPPTPA